MKLNNRAVDNAKPREKKWKLADGGGLHLLVHPNGGKYSDFYAGPINEDCDFVAEFYRRWWTTVTTTTSVSISGLPEGKTFRCESVATNAAGNSAKSNVVEFKTQAPSAPGRPEILSTEVGDGEIYLTVLVRDDGGQSVVEYKATFTDGVNSYIGTSTSSPITVFGLTNDVAYTCTVTATNSVGTSPASRESDPITPEALSTGLPIWLLYQATQ